MKQKSLGVIIAIVFLLTNLSCQLINPAATIQPTNTPTEQPVQVVEDTLTPTEDFSAATQAAEQAILATEEAKVEAALEAEAAAATEEASRIMEQTAEVEIQATSQAQDMANTIQALADDGILEDPSGSYYWMEDFNENWAQIGWYQWWETGLAPTDFVIRGHTEWESASKTANWFDSGCGFVFREEDENNHYMIFLALDGNVYLKGYVDGIYREFGKEYYGKIEHVKGSADVMLVVEGDTIAYYVNEEKVLQRENSEIKDGNLALTLMSGTNKEYGTRCLISDIEIWDLTGQ